jgi:tRNA-splicing ligase RtcB (3'-phosphate/5'-hydroxy nucleic acid ligase)
MVDKYVIGDNKAVVYLPKFSIDKGTMSQIHYMVDHPSIVDARFMPDCHRGKGCCIGFTAPVKDKIVPNFVGGDIGCGIIAYPIGNIIKSEEQKKEIDDKIRELIPLGKHAHSEPTLTLDMIGEMGKDAYQIAVDFCHNFFKKHNTWLGGHMPNYDVTWFMEHCSKIGADYDSVTNSMGTLGGGNHFIEFNQGKDSQYVTIHSGSRCFGSYVCNYHQNKINDNRHFDREKHEKFIEKTKRSVKSSKELYKIDTMIRDEFYNNRHPLYLEDGETYEYYFDMIFAQIYAEHNRMHMLKTILNILNVKYVESHVIQSVHNYIDFDDFIMRKGAIKAYNDQLCIIALNMRDGFLLCEGKSNKDWNYSSAHGAGRLYDRNQARTKISFKEFKKSMEGIYSSSVVPETIDESPMAYKNVDLVKELIGDSVTIKEQLKPIINIKALS